MHSEAEPRNESLSVTWHDSVQTLTVETATMPFHTLGNRLSNRHAR